MIDLSGKRILFIAPRYYDYHLNIIQKLQLFGAEVDYYPEMVNDFINRCAKLLSSSFKNHLQQRYLQKTLDSVQSSHYNILFVIRGEILTPEFLDRLKSAITPNQSLLYQWDSMTHNNYEALIPCFDTAFTFDKIDSDRLGIRHLPLFYTDAYEKIAKNDDPKIYDIVFYGSFHSDRLSIIKTIDRQAKTHNLRFHHHLYITKFSLFRGLITRTLSVKDLPYLKTFTVPSSVIQDTYSRTKAVLDIEMANQNGLTIRTLEVLGANLKLITTNLNIMNEIIFDPKRIFCLDRKNIKLNRAFFDHQLESDPKIGQYHLDTWLATIFQKEAV
ncbi:MAG: hypothetical protein Q8S36_05855 [Sulfuricurvum sp.]|nr:hypothetical protein [Sulfuricurvum sp.]